METVVSGIRSTGHLHIGNYFGAIRNFLKMQHEHHCYFFIADMHALTTHPKSADFKRSVKNVLVEYLACGLDPELSTIYIQSDVPQIPELYLLMNMYAYVGELERCNSFKEKIRKHADNINAGLLTYPVLMATDIIIHKATKVPVGKDQEQHLEMARNFVNRFNHLYNVDYFPEPFAYNFGEQLVKVPGLDGSGKMGKSEGEGNAIFLSEDPASIKKKIMRAVTDSGPTEPNQEKPEVIQNLFALMELVSDPETIRFFDESYNNCTIRYGDLKKQLAEDMVAFTAPLKEKIDALHANDSYLNDVMQAGAEKARKSAAKTLKEVREIIGFMHS
jgi:tryptophanyl-tRNA synthetase